MNARYGDMLAAIQKHDKGLHRYSRYSGESVAILSAAIRNKARGDFNLLGAAQHYMAQNFIDFDAPKSEAHVNTVDTTTQQEQHPSEVKKTKTRTYLKKDVVSAFATQDEFAQVKKIIAYCRENLAFSFCKIAKATDLHASYIRRQFSGYSYNRINKRNAQKIIQFGQSLGINT